MVGFLKQLTAVMAFGALVHAETHVFNWTTGWGTANLDNMKERPVITCNGEFPWPDIQINKGDTVNLYLTNGFTDMNTSLHFHGLFQHGSAQMDGPEMVTQCPIGPGQTFLYNFTVDDQHGSYWYHSHTGGQYMDGMRGLFIIHDEDYPYEQGKDYDQEASLFFSEWYHDTTMELLPKFLNKNNPTGAEPIPQNFLMNGTRNATWEVEPDTTYLLRLINIGGFTSYWFFIEDHEFEVIEVDGVPVERYNTSIIYITVAQRYTVLLKTKSDTSKNYAIMQLCDTGMLDVQPSDLIVNSTHYLVYDADNETPDEAYVDCLDDDCYLDDLLLVPVNKVELYDDADYTLTISVVMDNLLNGVNYAFFNNITYTAPKTPTLLTALAAGNLSTNEVVYGTNTHAIVLQKDDIIDIVLNNEDTGKHPFHLHGHVFQLIDRAPAVDDADPFVHFNEDNHTAFPEYPMMRDTVYVREQSNMVLRFKADNPGVWFFHCHIEWHLEQGLALTFVEAPEEIQKNASQHLTDSHKAICENLGINVDTNAAGNTDFLDLTGQNVQRKNIPTGFTAKGYVAFVFSCVAGVLGLATIAVYGLMDIKNTRVVEDFVQDYNIDLVDDNDAGSSGSNELNNSSEAEKLH
ncbi:CYFA0S12e02652g1_1 [Cyberlindnera fabianii]|uniref:CYFA0S12e02652g1_1 n=1 Tax=Cyberlindnera fabianii TaxID=36022 RepID=A0A061B2E2_CYBFA|nr:Iron transport multicopper oxidase FET3 [Cyberlindnera fabianii]CDR43621.1 CYFA0S12e02652g1_1 [Cyberlindnera fabianii]